MSYLITKKSNHPSDSIKDYMESYLKNKPPDCFLYSEDGTQFKTHKELFGQTKFMREILKSANCCGAVEIIFPCSREELGEIIDFVNNGKIEYDEKTKEKPWDILRNLTGHNPGFST